MNYEQLIDVLDSITWYNDIYEPLLDLKKDLLNCDNKGNYTNCNDNLEYFYNEQFEIFWMMLVLMFGDYGTSPRSGWLYLDKKEKIIEFIDKITKTSQEDLNKVD
jgi:lipoprotein NlpI